MYTEVQRKKKRKKNTEHPGAKQRDIGDVKKLKKTQSKTMQRAKKQVQTKHNLHRMHAVLTFPYP